MVVRRVWPSRPAFGTVPTELEQLRREMMRLIDAASATGEPAAAGAFPPVNVTQDADNFYLRAEVPGVRASELSISALRDRLAISGRREIPRESERVSYHRRERPEGTFNRTLTFPTEIDAARIEARYADGILSITLPKSEDAKPRTINVKT